MQRLQIGQKICAGRFEIESLLGFGGSGEVYLGRDLRGEEGKLVALKIFTEAVSGGTAILEVTAQIQSEASTLSKINSNKVVRGQELVSDSDMTILVQEYLTGGSLQDAIRTNVRTFATIGEWLRLAIALADGLDAAHSEGLIHGDIKPANIGFRDVEHQQIVYHDFGQAALINNRDFLTRTTQALGTLPYLAPERTGFIQSSRDEQSDLYSLGATLYEMAAGHPPFQEPTPAALLEKILNGVATPLCNIVSDFPEPLSDIVLKLLRKNPDERYFSACGLALDLKACLHSFESNHTIVPFALGKSDRFRELNNKSTFVGRASEIGKLTGMLSETISGKGGCAFIGAPSGAGKSSLCRQVAIEAADKNMLTMTGKFSEFERNLPLSAILSVIQTFLTKMRLEPASKQEEWASKTAAKLGPKITLLTHRLGFLRDVFALGQGPAHQEFEDEQTAFAESIVELIAEMGTYHDGLMLVLDDLQWADSESMSVVEVITEYARRDVLGKILLLGCYRSNEVSQEHPLHLRVLQYQTRQSHFELGPLSEAESDLLVAHLIDETGPEISKLQRMCYQLTQGNPFYLREYLGFCLAREIFNANANGSNWTFDITKAQNASLTFGIASLVSERISELNPEARQLLLVASAVGNEVSRSAIEYLLQEKEIVTPILRSLTELTDKHLIFFNSEKMTFVHDKVREAAYQLAGHELRKDCHHNYAVWLHKKIDAEGLVNPQRTASNEIFELAYHLKNGSPDKNPAWARRILLDAGRMALKIFAYQKALEYSQTAQELLPQDCSNSALLMQEFIEITELLADARVLNADPVGAVNLYESIIPSVEDRLHKSEILAKVCDCNLTLFRYRNSLERGEQGIKLLGKSIDTSELKALLVIVGMFIPFCIGLVYWRFFGRQRESENSREEQVVFKLIISLQVGLFFSRPLCAVSNQMRYTFAFLRQRPNQLRAIMVSYWAVILATFGLARIADPLFRNALKYFEQNPDPIYRAFVLFVWSYLNEFPRARIKEAHARHIQALDLLENAGESFYRVLTMQGLIQMDEYALGNGESYALHTKYAELILRIKQAPTILDAVLRHLLLTGNSADFARYEALVIQAANTNKSDGFDTVDACYARISLGEINLMREDPERALPYLQDAFGSITRHFHRIVYCIFAPVLLATCYVRLNRPLAAIPPLMLAWINQLFSARLLLPKTIFITGEMFYRNGFQVFGRWLAQKGIARAEHLRLPAIFFELRMYLAHLIIDEDPEYAQVLYRMCREYYSERQYVYFVDRCDRGTARTEEIMETKQENVGLTSQSGSNLSLTELIRPKVELESLLQIFLTLSATTNKTQLLDEALDAMNKCTGARFAVLFLYEEKNLVPVSSLGIPLDNLRISLNPANGVDQWFLEKCGQEANLEPTIRPKAWRTAHEACDGSVMVVPLAFKEHVYGYCYLARPDITDYFDARSKQIVSPLASQAAIAYQNFILFNSKEEKARIEAELEAARAVQDALLPDDIQVPNTLISHFYEPASETGGDWYHHHYDPIRNRLFILVGDVTGHGLPSALLTAVVSGAVLSHLQKESKRPIERLTSIQESLNELSMIANASVHMSGSESQRYMTMAFACLDLQSGEFGLMSAGHVPPYIYSQCENSVTTLPCSGSLLGFSKSPSFGYAAFTLNPGDSVLFYTDGLLENSTEKGPMLSSRMLRKKLIQNDSPQNCVESISQIFTAVGKERPLEDDVTVYMLRWDGSVSQVTAEAG
ncbi:MAG: Serine/threonine-protein kinase PknL [Pseudomonadota bacterium]